MGGWRELMKAQEQASILYVMSFPYFSCLCVFLVFVFCELAVGMGRVAGRNNQSTIVIKAYHPPMFLCQR